MDTLVIQQNGNSYQVNAVPDECPICHHRIEPIPAYAKLVGIDVPPETRLSVMFLCPQRHCELTFLVHYARRTEGGRGQGPYILQTIAPQTPKDPDIPQQVRELSPAYVEIFTQATVAEAYPLDQIAGVGYRKALEFLIKDYCSQQHPDQEKTIKEISLGNCIAKYVTDPNVNKCAQLASWLGNDETHYIRKWAEKDIKHLKTLIRLTEAWIVNVELTEQYVREMQPEKG
jgi:hypothetical protein